MNKSLLSKLTIMIGALILGGCSPEKAQTVQQMAERFRAESLEAIAMVDQIHQAELASPSTFNRMNGGVNQEFITNILGYDRPLEGMVVDLALDPYSIQITPENQQRWDNFIGELNSQYNAFADIYQDLAQGSYVAGEQVTKSAEFGKKLTVQMLGLAVYLDQYPPQLIQERTALLGELDQLRQEYQTLNQLQIERSLRQEKQKLIEAKAALLIEQWQGLKLKESNLQKEGVLQALEAAKIGEGLLKLIDDYNRLNLHQLTLFSTNLFKTTDNLEHQAYGYLTGTAQKLLQDITSSALWNTDLARVLNEVNQVMGTRGGSSSLNQPLPQGDGLNLPPLPGTLMLTPN